VAKNLLLLLKNSTREVAQNLLIKLGKQIKEHKISLSEECAKASGIQELNLTVSMGVDQIENSQNLKACMETC
jgi:hypothetical protein